MQKIHSGETDNAAANIFAGGGEMKARMRAIDWTKTPLGAVDKWQKSLKIAVQLMLNSRFSMFIWWGKDLVYLYNDAYLPTLGIHHPQALGKSASEVWSEVWKDIEPQVKLVLERGEATWNEELLLFLERHGFREETYHTFSYSPIIDDTNNIGGLFCAVSEETQKVLNRRRLQTLRDLGERSLAEAKTVNEACRAAAQVLSENPFDIPFALIYLLDADGKQARLVETIKVDGNKKAAPPVIEINRPTDIWEFQQVLTDERGRRMSDIEQKFGQLSAGAWTDDTTGEAFIVPLAKTGTQDFPAGFLVAGISPRLVFDADYQGFLELAAGHIATSIANAEALEAERKRAEALAELDRAKTEFFSNVSHEFRTPLTLMLGNLEEVLRKDENLPATEREQIETAHRNSLRLLKLVNNLLDFSRIEAGKATAHFEPTDLARLTADLASNFRAGTEKAGIKLKVNCPQLSQAVAVDREMWEKIVLNLLSNAFKFTLKGKIEVSLKENGDSIELKVRDTGVGINSEELPNIFERFHRVRATQGRTHEGTGIGLSLVHELVKLHNGTIDVKSKLGRGTEFTVILPKNAKGKEKGLTKNKLDALPVNFEKQRTNWQSYILDSADENQTEIGLTDPALLPFYQEAKILLAEDNADMRSYIKRLLGENGYTVETVRDGQDAFEKLQNENAPLPDLVLTDVMMPRLDGFQLIEKIRNDARIREIPVIMLSARAGEESKIEGLESGADDYLIKPFSARELLARVESVIELSKMRRAAENRARLLAQINELVRRIENPQNLLYEVSKAIGEHLEVRRCLFNEIDLENDLEIVYRDYCRGVESVAGKHKISIYSSVTSAEMVSGRTVVNHNSKTDSRTADCYEEIYAKTGERAYIAVPLLRENRWVASLWVSDDKPRRWHKEEVNLLEIIAEQIWAVVEKLRIDAALRESEKRFRNMADHAPVMVWVTDATGYCQYLSQSWYEFTGQTPETGLGYGWLEATHPKDSSRVEGIFLAANEQRTMFQVEYRLRGNDGEYRWMIDSAQPRFDESGEFLGFIGSVIDIAERKKAEMELTRLAAIVSTSFDAILSKTIDGIITSWNASAERMFGYTAREIVGQPILRLIPPERHEEETLIISRLKAGEIIEHYETVRVTKDGRPLDVSLTISPLKDSSGKIIGASKIIRDITAAKLAEQERERLLESEQLAREEAETANRLKDEFLATVSHELRTPLNAILGWATMARGKGQDAEIMSRALEVIERSARNQNKIISDILDVSRIITGKLNLNMRQIRLPLIIQSAIDTVRPSLEAKQISLETVFDADDGVKMTGDADRLQQIVWNLLSNAVKFTPENGKIEVSLKYQTGFAEILIKDNGEGIPTEFLPFVFDRFRQADSKWSRKHGGLGLGLAVVRHLTELHGGSVSVESGGIGQGASFRIRLPLKTQSVQAESDKSAAQKTDGKNAGNEAAHGVLDDLKILVVDDQPDALDLAAFILAEQGAFVLTAASVEEALRVYEREPLNLIVSDIGMPEKDGYQLIRELRRRTNGQNGHIPVIALTAYAGETEKQRILQAGFLAYLPKPIEPSELVKTVAEISNRLCSPN